VTSVVTIGGTDMAIRIHSPSALKYAKVLVYAPPGAGKTYLIGTAQQDDRTYPMLFLDFDAGSETLDGLDIDVIRIRSWRDSDEVLEALERQEILEIDGKEYDFGNYRSIGIDSISEWNRWAQLHILAKEGKSRRDPDLIELKDYNRVGVQLRRVLRRYRDLPLHVFLSAHAQDREEPRVGMIKKPDLSGQLADEIAGLVSTVGYLAVDRDNGERVLILHGYKEYRTKCRTPWNTTAPEVIESPDITEIMDVLGYRKNGRP
jgi:phage nucleotide-binding protein